MRAPNALQTHGTTYACLHRSYSLLPTQKEELEKRLEAQAAAQQAQQAAFERQVDKLQRALLDQRAALHQANKVGRKRDECYICRLNNDQDVPLRCQSRFAPRQVEIQSVRLEAERKLQAQKDEHLQAMAQVRCPSFGCVALRLRGAGMV